MNSLTQHPVLLFLFLAAFLTSCSYERRCQRAQNRIARLTKACPDILKPDTISLQDTLIIPSVTVDTFTLLSHLTDTVTITRDGVVTRLFMRGDTVFVRTQCPGDTIVRTLRVPYEKIIVKPFTFWDKLKAAGSILLWIAIAILLFAAGRYFVRRLY